MSLYDYRAAIAIDSQHPPFYALIQAAMLKADTDNLDKLKAAWPEEWEDLSKRYNAPGGLLYGEVEL